MKEKNKERKRSNKKTAIMIVVVIIAFIGGLLIVRGSWNPFKSHELSQEAKTAYENSLQQTADLYNDVNIYNSEQQGENLDIPPLYLPTGQCPYGFEVTDYGEKGKNGMLKQCMGQLYVDFEAVYGMNAFFIYYMKNEDYAKEKYSQLYGQYCQKDYKQSTSNSRVGFGVDGDNQLCYMIMIKGTVVYYGMFNDYANYSKTQHLYDKLGIDFKLPDMEHIFN